MAGNFESLLIDVSTKAERVAVLAETLLDRIESLEKDVKELRELRAEIKTNEKWNGRERRKVDERLGSGDQTFKRLILEVDGLKRDMLALKRASGQTSSRRFKLWQVVLQGAVPILVSGAVSGVAWLIMSAVSKGGSP